ncbi:MAG: elongation factor G [bacterium]|jgi:elongation factor G
MKNYQSEQLRNICFIGHGGTGKTSLAEALLYDAGAIDRLGRVDDGTAALDFDPEEVKRKISVSTGIAACAWKDNKINIIDAPGYFDFVGEVKAALRVVECGVIVLDAVGGVEVGAELVWNYAAENNLARLLFVNKMDRENANFTAVLEKARNTFGNGVAPIQLPIGSQDNFKGVVDLVKMKAYVYTGSQSGKYEETEIPAELMAQAEEYREMLVEAAAEGDDDLTMKYLEGEPLTDDEIALGLRKGTVAKKVFPLLCGAAQKNIGAAQLLDAIVSYVPSPVEIDPIMGNNPANKEAVTIRPVAEAPFCGLVFKTMADPYVGKLTLFRVYSGKLKSDSGFYNSVKEKTERVGQLFFPRGKHQDAVSEVQAGDIAAVAKLQETSTNDTICDKENPVVINPIEFPSPTLRLAVLPRSKGDEDKLGTGLARLAEEDPTFTVGKDTTTGQLIASGMGELHIEVITSRLHKKFGVEVNLETPKVPYKETIRAAVKVEGKHKKQSGGRGQFGHVWVEFEPLHDGQDFEFVDKIFGGSVPRQYIPAVEKGLREVKDEGVLAGYPVVNFRATLYDGSFHPVDSSEMAFKIAASLAFKKGMEQAKPVLLEPIMHVEVIVPDAYMGDIIGDLNKKRGRILGMEPQGGTQLVKAQVPLAEMFKYATDLRSMTQGRGVFTMNFDHYEEVPGNIAENVIEITRKEREAENK